MASNHPRRAFTLWLALALLASACSQDSEPAPPANRPPTVALTAGPPEGDPDSSYRVHFEWSGSDSDGAIDRFEYLMTNDELTGPLIIDGEIYARLAALGYTWAPTENQGGDFVVAADQVPDLDEPADSVYVYGDHFLFHAQHTFFLRAVDDDGALSTLPAFRGFTATTLAPDVFTIQPLDLDEPGGWDDFSTQIHFRWTASDSVGNGEVIEPDSTRFALFAAADLPGLADAGLLFELPDSAWSPWRALADDESAAPAGGRHARVGPLTPFSGGELGRYCFFVQAKDEAGALTSHFRDGRNLRRFRALAGQSPRILVTEPTFGSHGFYTDESTWDLTVYQGFRCELSWRGIAHSYGGEVVGYRYGWNLADTGDAGSWSNWSLDYTSMIAELSLGEHRFYLQCRDDAGNVTMATIVLHVVPLSMEYDLALIDDYTNVGTSNPAYGWPAGASYTWTNYTHSDADMEDWWTAILADYEGFVPARDLFRISLSQDQPPMEFLGSYGRVIWEVKESAPGQSGLARISRFVDIDDSSAQPPLDYLSLWLGRGGQLLLCGSMPVKAMLPLANDMGDQSYERKLPMHMESALGYSNSNAEESAAAVARFLPRRWLGVESVTAPVDPQPKQYGVATAYDFDTARTHWGMVGARLTGESLAAYGNATGWTPPDTLRFKPEVYAWFADAGPIFNNPADGCAEAAYFGLADAEIYNWWWLLTVIAEATAYDAANYLPLLTYLPADSTTRWGSEPASEHCYLSDMGGGRDESAFALAGYYEHPVGLIGRRDPERPSVVLGFSPFFLDVETGRGLLGHILTDVMALPR